MPKDTVILSWTMDEVSWSYWLNSFSKGKPRDIILKGIKKIRDCPAARKGVLGNCEAIRLTIGDQSESYTPPYPGLRSTKEQRRVKIEIEVPGKDWEEACRLIGEDVKPSELLSALIIENKGWQQDGNETRITHLGVREASLILCLLDSTHLTHTQRQGPAKYEWLSPWIIAVATVATAVAAWLVFFLAESGN